MFLDPVARQRIPDWEHHARRMAAQFRLAYDHLTDHPEFHRLATDLRSGSADFERAWMSHDVMSVAAGRKEIIHPHLGHLRFEHGVFGVNENPALKMVIYVATKENDTAHKMSGALA